MNSPPNPGSPTSSTSSLTDRESDEFLGGGSTQLAPTPLASGPMAAKRRPPQGTPAKSRRLERERERPQRGPGSSTLSTIDATSGISAAARAKEELVDSDVLEQFKKDFGDPFDDSILKSNA